MRAIPCFELGIKCGSIAIKKIVSHIYVYHVDFPTFDIPLVNLIFVCITFSNLYNFLMVAETGD